MGGNVLRRSPDTAAGPRRSRHLAPEAATELATDRSGVSSVSYPTRLRALTPVRLGLCASRSRAPHMHVRARSGCRPAFCNPLWLTAMKGESLPRDTDTKLYIAHTCGDALPSFEDRPDGDNAVTDCLPRNMHDHSPFAIGQRRATLSREGHRQWRGEGLAGRRDLRARFGRSS